MLLMLGVKTGFYWWLLMFGVWVLGSWSLYRNWKKGEFNWSRKDGISGGRTFTREKNPQQFQGLMIVSVIINVLWLAFVVIYGVTLLFDLPNNRNVNQ